MPNFDKTGTHDNGPMTGRGRGRCRVDRAGEPEKNESQIIESDAVIPGTGLGNYRGERGWLNWSVGGYRKGFRGGKKRGRGRNSDAV